MAAASVSLSEYAEYEKTIADLEANIDRLSRKLAKRDSDTEKLVGAVYSAVSDHLPALKIPAVPKPKAVKASKHEEVCVPLFSDLQLAKTTPDYDSLVCEKRIELYASKIIEVANIQRSHHPVRKCVVHCLGDIIEGEAIFPGQSYLVDGGLYRQITIDGPRIVVNFLRTLLTDFQEVEVVWVIGNHGRIGGRGARTEQDPETNGDRMLGKIVEMMFANEPRIKFTVPDGRRERNWYAVSEIGNYSALLIHGDQIKGHSGFPWYGLGKKANGWASGAIPERFDDIHMGHWHQLARIPLNKRSVYVNGSTESYNTYAQENLAAMSDPSQWLLFVHPEKGKVTSSYGIDLV